MEGDCATVVCAVGFTVNWPAGIALLLTAVAIAMVARLWSGSFAAPWAGHRPPIWFLVVLVLPPVGVALFVIGAVKQLRAERERNGHVDLRS